MSENKKMGRPIIGEPKDIPLQLRMDRKSVEKLERLCQKYQIKSKSEMIRLLIDKAK